jgi:predicted DNA-binding transcriptional regulator YafY
MMNVINARYGGCPMKLERLMAITILLLNRKRVQAQELADRMEVSLRTIYRDLESLGIAGIPIVSYTGIEGGYEIMESFRLDRQMLSFDELIALFTALRGLQSTEAMKHSDIERLLEKVGSLVSHAEQGRLAESDRVHIDFIPWRRSEEDQNKYDLLRIAVQENKLIRFTYTDRQGVETERYIEPMAFALKSYVWYMQGYCLDREDYRTFKLSRIRDLQILADSFPRRSIELSSLKDRWVQPRDHSYVDLILRFSEAAKVSVTDQFDEAEIERLADGSLLVRTAFPDENWIIGFLLKFKTDVYIVEPAHIAAEVRNMALSIAALYDK